MSFCQYCGARLDNLSSRPPAANERTRTSPESPLARVSEPAVSEPSFSGALDLASSDAIPIAPGAPTAPPPRIVPAAPPSGRRAPPPPPQRSNPHPQTQPVPQMSEPAIPPPVLPSVETSRYAPADLGRAAARLVVIAQDGSPGREYPLTTDQTDIGRDEGNILLPNDPYVSPRHARIVRRGQRFLIQDLDSVNGIYVRLKNPSKLEHGDLVLMGLEVLRFEVVSAADKGYGPATDRATQVFGSPASPRFAKLCQRTVEGVTRDTFYITRDETVVGRESGDIVFTGDPFMSRRHAAISRNTADNSFSVRDLGSSNGTYIRIRGEHEIFEGDHVRIGQHLFRLEVASGGQA